jgi:autotransporter strand-loop-strand O-heptosyltransferase
MEFINPGETAQNLYASYRIACVDNDTELHKTPWREVELSRVCSDILNIPYEEEKCKVNPSNKPRPIKEKYVCISTSSTAGCKLWHGWQGVVDNLNSRGYKVVVIQKEPLDYMDLEGLDNVIFPENKDINEAINWLEYCEFFIGLSSGVSWLAHSLGKEVVMIAGFTEPFNEFSCIRLINKAKCYGCWHKHKFDRGDWNWCPEHKGTERQFECMKSIKVEDVIQALPIKV